MFAGNPQLVEQVSEPRVCISYSVKAIFYPFSKLLSRKMKDQSCYLKGINCISCFSVATWMILFQHDLFLSTDILQLTSFGQCFWNRKILAVKLCRCKFNKCKWWWNLNTVKIRRITYWRFEREDGRSEGLAKNEGLASETSVSDTPNFRGV